MRFYFLNRDFHLSPTLIIVTPVYEDNEAASQLFKALSTELGTNVYVVAVDDGSVRNPVSPQALVDADISGAVLRLKRNVGHQRAIATGLGYVAAHHPKCPCVVMDSDGEDMPESIPTLTQILQNDDIEIAVAQRQKRRENLTFRMFYAVYKQFFWVLTGKRINFGNFMALKPISVRRLVAMPELPTHIAGTALLSKLRVGFQSIDRGRRYAGKSRMSFSGLILHGFRALMVFSEDVQLRVGLFCAVLAGFSVMGIVAAIILKAIGFATPGWFSIVLGVLVLTLLQTATLSLMTLLISGSARFSNMPMPDYAFLIDEVLLTGPLSPPAGEDISSERPSLDIRRGAAE